MENSKGRIRICPFDFSFLLFFNKRPSENHISDGLFVGLKSIHLIIFDADLWGGVYFCTEWVEEKNGENLYGAWV